MSSAIHYNCPKCRNPPSCLKLFSYDGYAVTCEPCGGLYAMGRTREAAWACWDRSVAEGDIEIRTKG